MHGVEDVNIHVRPPSRQSSFGLEPGLAPSTHWCTEFPVRGSAGSNIGLGTEISFPLRGVRSETCL